MTSFQKAFAIAAIAAFVLGIAADSRASAVYIADEDFLFTAYANAKNDLTGLGATVTVGNPLTDYSSYDEVWELDTGTSFSVRSMSTGEKTALGNYLASGGRVFLAGDSDQFDTRNNSIVAFVSDVGGGALNLFDNSVNGFQSITAAGQVVNTPNALSSIEYSAARTVNSVGSGFLVTETSTAGVGSMVGWDFGDISGSPNARMVVSFDVDIFTTLSGNNGTDGQNVAENIYHYLLAPLPPSLPEPAAFILFGLGLAPLGWVRRRGIV